jgi:hypothetical protein
MKSKAMEFFSDGVKDHEKDTRWDHEKGTILKVGK